MPNQPRANNRHRMVRVEDDLWEAAKTAAHENGTTVSAVIREALRQYVSGDGGVRRIAAAVSAAEGAAKAAALARAEGDLRARR